MEKYGVGAKFITNEGYEVEIVEKIDRNKRKVRFESGHEVEAHIKSIGAGKIKNPHHSSVFGIGCYGVGEYKSNINGNHALEYDTWKSMIQRCYDDKHQQRCPTYKNTTICEEWKNYQNFAEWYSESFHKIKGVKFQLDKDLLQNNVKNKIYSPDTCVFLPHNVNSFLANKKTYNTSNYTGVHWHKTNKKWQAEIMVFGENKKKNLGFFSTPEEASFAYQKARSEQAEKAKEYLRSLNYLPENIIELIK